LGFADDNQQLFIYDKIRNEILEGQNLVANSMKTIEQFSALMEKFCLVLKKHYLHLIQSCSPFSRFRNATNYEFSAYDKG
jgi:hypothetical protein